MSKAIAEVIGASKKEEGYLEGKGCIVSWCFGHLAEYVSPDSYDERFTRWLYEDLPIIPEEWKLAVSKDKKEQFYILKKLLNRPDIEFVVNACDAGREGELIFKHVYDLSGSKKPVKRLWISSLESSSILEGMEHLKAGETYHNLAEAAVCRAQADWLVGMNATRAYTTKYFKKLTVGRVQTPTLAMLVERQNQISGFKKEKYFNVVLDFDGLIAEKKKIFDVEEAERMWKTCQGSDAIVEKVESKEKTVKPPKLYDLTTLQREANRIYGMTAQQTLNAAQSLYEQKLITYPRTDSQYLTTCRTIYRRKVSECRENQTKRRKRRDTENQISKKKGGYELMSKVTFEEDELAVVALFQENTRKDTIDILKDTLEVLEETKEDPLEDDLLETIASAISKLQMIEDKYYYSLDLNRYLNNLEDDAYEE